MSDTTVRRAVGIGIAEFTAHVGDSDAPQPWPPLPFATQRVIAVSEALRRYSYECQVLQEPAKLAGATMADTIWAASEGLRAEDFLVVHVVSHGLVADSGALYVVGADGRHHPFSQVDQWLMRVSDFPTGPHMLFLLDLCHAGAPVRQSWQLNLVDRETRALVVAACRPHEVAFKGQFSQAVANVLVRFADSGIDIDPSRPHLPLDTVARAVRQEVKRLAEEQAALPQEVTATLLDLASEPVDLSFFPNARHVPDGRRRARPRVDSAVAPFLDDVDDGLDPMHFMERAAGHTGYQQRHEQGCFSGRKRELRILSAWFDSQDDVRVRVVTGSPGVGKSALVGLLVCAAHPVLREPTRTIWENVERAPFLNTRFAAVHARQRTAAELMASLGRQLGLAAPEGGSWEVEDFLGQIVERAELPVIVMDALDEAEQYRQVMRELLLPLATVERPDGAPACRLLVAMRPWPELRPLRDVADEAGGLIDLDKVPLDQLRWDIEEYVSGLVRCRPPYDQARYSGPRAAFAAAVAETLTKSPAGEEDDDHKWGAFLVAGLYARHLTTVHEPISDNAVALELGGQVPSTLPDLLRLDLSTRSRVRWLEPVLTVLAYARGDGMSAYTVQQAARAFGAAGNSAPSDQQVADALRAARFYLRRSADSDGSTLYRLFHQGLADHLRGPDQSRRASAERLAQCLLASLETPGRAGRRWDLAEPYLRRQIAHHVIDAESVALLADDVEFLVYGEAGGVCAVLNAIDGLGWLDARSYTRMIHSTDGSIAARRYGLALLALRHGMTDIARRLANPPGQPPLIWQPQWLAAPPVRDVRQAAVLLDPAPAALAVVKDRGVPYAVLAAESERVGAWRLDTPRRIWSSDGVAQPAAVPPPGEPLLIGLMSSDVWYSLRGSHGSINGLSSERREQAHWATRVEETSGTRQWIESGAAGHLLLRVSPATHRGDDPAMADTFGLEQMRSIKTEVGELVVVGHPRGGIRLYRHGANGPSGLQPAGIIPLEAPVTALDAVTTTGTVLIAAAVGHEFEVFRWSLRHCRLTGRRAFGRVGEVHLVRAVLCGHDLFAVTVGAEALAWRWRRTAPMPDGKRLRSDPVSAVATADDAGLVAVGTTNGTVAVYAADGGRPSTEPVQVHPSAISSLDFGTVDGRLALVAGSTQGAVAWIDPVTGRLLTWATVHEGEVVAANLVRLSDRPLLISAGKDGVRLTDPDTGQSSPSWMDGGPPATHRPVRFAAGGRDLTAEVDHRGVVHLYDVGSNRRIARIELGKPVLDVTATTRGDLVLRLSRDVVFLRWTA